MLLIACSASKTPAEPAKKLAPVSSAKTSGAPSGHSRGFVGIVVANQVADLVSRIDGRIDAVNFRVGDPVKQGSIVVTLNVKALKHDLAKAEAQLKFGEAEVAKANVELAQSLDLLARQKKLTKFISEEELRAAEYKTNAAQAQIKSAEAKVAEEQAAVSQLKDLIAEAQLRAPFAGVLGERFYDPGVWVKQNTPIVRMIGGGEPRVRFAVPEEEAGTVVIDRPVIVELGPKDRVSGRVSHVAAEIDPASGTLTAEALFDAKERARSLVPGSVARVFVQPSDARVQNFRR